MQWAEWLHTGNPDNTGRRGIVLQAVASRKAGRWPSLVNAIEFMDGQRVTAVYRPQPDTRDGIMEIEMALKKCVDWDWKPRDIWRATAT